MATMHQRRARLSIDISREARRRIRIAAAKRDKSIREYVWEAVEARLKHDLVDEKGAKQRPGLIVSIDRYHQGRREMILAAITSNVGRLLVGDYKIKGWRESGLLYPSIVTGIVRTIKQDMIAGKLGELPAPELHTVEDKLREILAL